MAFNGGEGGQRSIVFVAILRDKSVAYRCVERKARIAKMCKLCKFIVAVFGRFSLKCATYSFSGA